MTLARGALAVRVGVAQYLFQAFPTMRNKALAAWGLNGPDVPEIKVFNPYGLTAFESNSGPVLGVYVRRGSRWSRTDLDDYAQESYEPTYNVTLQMYCYSLVDDTGASIGNPRNIVTRIRDDLVNIVRQCLLDRPSLGTDYLTFQQQTLVEEYPDPDPVPNNSQRWYAGASLTFDVKVDESQLRAALNDPTKPNIFTVEGVVDNTGRDQEPSNLDRLP